MEADSSQSDNNVATDDSTALSTRQNDAKKQSRNDQNRDSNRLLPILRLDVIAVIISFAILLVLIFQGLEIKKANEVAGKSASAALEQVGIMQRSQRAFISLAYDWEYGVTDLGNVQFSFVWRNSGMTVAKSGIAAVGGFGQPSELEPVDFSRCFGQGLTATTASQRALGPGDTTESKHTIPLSILSMIADGKTRGFICGFFLYRDVFEGSPVRLTEFCKELDSVKISKNENRLDIQVWLRSCSTHNCFDEDCPDYTDRVKDYEQKSKEFVEQIRQPQVIR